MMATRWGCLGTGRVAWDFFYAIKDNLPAQDHEFVAVASRDVSRAQEHADRLQFKRAYGRYDDVAKDEEVEVVYIATVNALHAELSIKMLEAGKHVLCEKPMAMNQNEARRVFEAARKNKRLFMEGYWSHFFPTYAQIRKELAAGTLGDIRLVQANFCIQMTTDPRAGGGGVMLIGGYPAMLASMVFKEKPESIKAMAMMTPEKDMDMGGCYLLKYGNGAMASVMYHMDTGDGDCSATIIGTKGKLQIQGPFFAPVKITTPTGTYEFPMKEGKYNFPNSAGFQYEAAAMRENIRNGRQEDEWSTMAMSDLIVSITDEVRRQIGLVYPGLE